MLNAELLNSLKTYTASMQRPVTLVVQQGEHPKRAELMTFLAEFCSVSEHLVVAERDAGLRSPVSFELEVEGEPSGVRFSGIPGGHEFTSLVLAVLQLSGTPLKLDEQVQNLVRGVRDDLHFEVFVSLSCHNCPDVVQVLNQFAILNPYIRSEMIDGGLFQDVIEKRDIQGVPTVYLNGEVFANGKIDTAQLVDRLVARFPQLRDRARPTEKLPLQDVTIVGSGPAGAAAAIYAARKGLAVTLIGDRAGGQLKDTLGIENLISVPYTTGPQLTGALVEHMSAYDITTREHVRVTRVHKGEVKRLELSSGEEIETRALIIATGAKWRELGVPGEKEYVGNGVAYCPHCDGPFFRGKDVAVIGGGNSGVEAALDLAGIVRSVTVLEFLPDLKADKVLVDQLQKRDNVTVITNAATQQILAEGGKVTGLEYQDRDSGRSHRIDLAGVFVQIGLVPNSDFLEGVVERTRYGEVLVNERGETSEPGIFACGDVTTVPYKQIIVAMGEGAKASLSAFDYLLKAA